MAAQVSLDAEERQSSARGHREGKCLMGKERGPSTKFHPIMKARRRAYQVQRRVKHRCVENLPGIK